MYLDVESSVTLNAMRRAEIHREIVGVHRVRYPWVDRAPTRQSWAGRQPLRALRTVLSGLHGTAPMKQPVR